ncbi:hypothetical protein SUNI508_12297 [Seiridium unicorne]|uniref:Peptidase S33 tripeptidyl aminopeptidase-like C-terminal domain-containing protein n=1 Tax=Seiridium unicorne TaxID=138068 RepID=A0ABR2UEB7_9PEZI
MRLQQLYALLGCTCLATVTAKIEDFDWGTITPSKQLEYTPCYENLQCARLTVPLDWLDETNPHTVDIAITKRPAQVADDDPAFGGTIFINPGGPGVSGVSFLLEYGQQLHNVVDGKRRYELLTWDPRGVGFTSPKADCFGDVSARDIADLQRMAIGPLDSSEDVLRRQWAWAQAYGELCTSNVTNNSIIPYLTTPSVVRDMVEMLDKVHELRDGKKFIKLTGNDDEQARLKRGNADVPRIQYWGFSYGSFLGNTFASMYPGRVGRLINDGILNADDYAAGEWLENLQDTEEIVKSFYESCFEAGNECTLNKPSDTKWEDLQQRVDDFVARANIAPIPTVHGTQITLVTGTEILGAFRRPIYQPLDGFKRLGELLSNALQGNHTLLLEDISAASPNLRNDICGSPNSSTIETLTWDALQGIFCGDGDDATQLGFSYFKSYIKELIGQSKTLGASWAKMRFNCAGWAIRPKWRFTGPFTTPKPDTSIIEGRPAAPLLFLTTRLDPVTPLRNAVAMAANHPEAAWVVQESWGHTTLAAPSRCIKHIIQEYLESGIVPESGTSCKPDCGPWNPCDQDMSGDIAGYGGLSKWFV